MNAALLVVVGLAAAPVTPTTPAAAGLVLAPVSIADAEGHQVDASTLQKVSQALTSAAAARKLRQPAAVSVPVPGAGSVPADLAALAASAQKAADELDTKNGVRLHRELIDKLSARLADVGDVGPLVDARLSLASLYLATKEALLAKTELDAAARQRPDAELDLARWPPALSEAFTASQARVKGEPGGDLDVQVQPAGAAVFVDGVRVGETPLTQPVRRGVHLLWVGAAGHVALLRAVEVGPGSRARVDEALAASPSWELGRRLDAELVGEGRRAEAVGIARALAKQEGAASVVVTALAPVPGGVAALLARTDDDPRVAIVTLDAALSGAATSLAAGLAALDDAPAAFSGGVVRVRGDGAPDPGDVKVDAKRALVGMVSSRRAAVATAVTPAQTTGPVRTGDVPPPAAAAEGDFPWGWVGGGAAVVVLAAAATGAALYLLQPTAERIQDPDTLALHVAVAP